MSGKKKIKPGGKRELAEAKARLEAELMRVEEELGQKARASEAAAARLDELRREKESVAAALAAAEAARAEAAADKDRLTSHVGQLRAALDDKDREAAQLRERLEAAIAICATLELRLEDALKEREELAAERERERSQWQSERDKLAREIEGLRRELEAWNGTLYARLRRSVIALLPAGLARPRR